jgi:hypothetical protein
MVCHTNDGTPVPRTKHAVCTSFNLLSILSSYTVLPVPFRYNPTTGIIIAHFSSRGKKLSDEEVQPRQCGKGAAAAGPVRGIDIGQRERGGILPRSLYEPKKEALVLLLLRYIRQELVDVLQVSLSPAYPVPPADRLLNALEAVIHLLGRNGVKRNFHRLILFGDNFALSQ